ncbi:MAG: PorP/SprF family type IX secretion system membrane protein [Bacteroidota bacterium]|nr:PorP/SprF family type IX secretion system membrane protein [Bacteroidota bacterium]
MKKICLLVTALMLTGLSIKAQDIHFSLYGEAPSVINPALTGVAYDLRANVNYKTQWKSFNSAYKTYAGNFEASLKHEKMTKAYMAAGINFYKDVAAGSKSDSKFTTTGISANFCTVITTGKNSKLSLGLTGGANSRNIKQYDSLTWENQYDGFKYDPSRPTGEADESRYSFSNADFGGGVNWHYSESNLYISSNNGSRFDIGASVYHFNSPKNTFYSFGDDKLNMRYNGYANAVFCFKESNICFAPGVLYQQQGANREIVTSALIRVILKQQSVHTKEEKPSAFSGGFQYRFKDALIPTFLFEYDKYAIGLAYDINLSKLTTASKSKGGFEFALRYNWNPGYGKMVGNSTSGASH